MQRSAISALAALAGLACAWPTSWQAGGTEWVRDATSAEQFEKDRDACETQTVEPVGDCMKARGYRPWGERTEYDRARESVPSRP